MKGNHFCSLSSNFEVIHLRSCSAVGSRFDTIKWQMSYFIANDKGESRVKYVSDLSSGSGLGSGPRGCVRSHFRSSEEVKEMDGRVSTYCSTRENCEGTWLFFSDPLRTSFRSRGRQGSNEIPRFDESLRLQVPYNIIIIRILNLPNDCSRSNNYNFWEVNYIASPRLCVFLSR